ncbi:MAG: hypothetical protein CBC13_08660 [Planctomycetia bacterium TMED53]|nr:MAG: hypothetical protein CBC13_08660 [Planctomycetia bacterium TMED53]
MSPADSGSHYRIPLSRPRISAADRQSVLSVLESTRLSGGPYTRQLEELASESLGVPVVSCSSGTAGLILALRALGVSGGEVITPSLGFIASAHAIRAVGATPKFCDVSAEDLCCGPEEVLAAWGDDVRAILPVDLLGVPAPMSALKSIAIDRGVPVIEDACEALGTRVDGDPCGSLADAASFGFYPNKILTMGEGGLVACRDQELANRVRQLANQGRTGPGFSFEGEGYNFRLTELQAALGASQWLDLEERVSDRIRVADQYREQLKSVSGVELSPSPDLSGERNRRSWFTFVVLLDKAEWRDHVRQDLADSGIETGLYFPPITQFKPYDQAPGGDLPVTESISPRMLALPFFPDLSSLEVEEVVLRLDRSLQNCLS